MPKIDSLVNDNQPGNEIKRLEKLVKQQAETIDRMRSANAKAPKVSGRGKGRKSFIRLIFGDVHGEHMDKDAVAAFLNDVSILKPQEAICIGDLIDVGGFLSQHKTLGVVAELDVSYEQDVAAGNMVLDEVAARTRLRRFDLIEGNHENRANRWICDQVLGSGKNADYLKRLVGPAHVLNLEKRGIRFIERHKHYDGLSITGACRAGKHAIASHGEAFCGQYSMFRHLQKLGESVFFGHSHRLGKVYAEKLKGPVVGVNTGCLCQRRPLYMLTKTTDWQHGYVAQVCSGDGFIAIPIPIINGVSYLEPLAKLLRL